MYSGLYFGAFLSVTPLALTGWGLRAQVGLSPPLEPWRTIVFRIGLLSSLVCAVISVCLWLDFKFDALLAPALSITALTFVLALFGRGSSQLLLCGAAVIQLVYAPDEK